jgi:hypothetical protein
MTFGMTAFAAQLDLLAFLLADLTAVLSPRTAFGHRTVAPWVSALIAASCHGRTSLRGMLRLFRAYR